MTDATPLQKVNSLGCSWVKQDCLHQAMAALLLRVSGLVPRLCNSPFPPYSLLSLHYHSSSFSRMVIQTVHLLGKDRCGPWAAEPGTHDLRLVLPRVLTERDVTVIVLVWQR